MKSFIKFLTKKQPPPNNPEPPASHPQGAAPALGKASFTCPKCHVSSEQQWLNPYVRLTQKYINYGIIRPIDWIKDSALASSITLDGSEGGGMIWSLLTGMSLSICSNCRTGSVWVGDKLVYPESGVLPLPEQKMPTEVKEIYLEASLVAQHSTRAAAGLLRLALQTLLLDICKQLEIPEVTHETRLARLVYLIKEDSSYGTILSRAMKRIKDIGNEALHPPAGEMISTTREELIFSAETLNLIVQGLDFIEKCKTHA